ncbi:GNAT family N-acetyltransferase [Staphylococcus sp. 17KM0847]|uniref:GNAT family N-acetyltransferase n=1 Tax=Staphylococcus sp. 17KM0847 TaxID=2583989 RepID=UPI0015DC91D5|nr:GNAT family N-acetyltransferase [Staphylococcus sp. 17KM0847]QLK86651.1 GNAT family N-acetyltransferase [Staphylococcus sp. 17KM0847]
MCATIDDIYTEGILIEDNIRYKQYLTPERPLKFDANKWCYKKMPDLLTFKDDMIQQQSLHQAQGSTHLNFEFPQDVKPSIELIQYLRAQNFNLGCVELYMIEAETLRELTTQTIHMKRMTSATIKDYFTVFRPLSMAYGEDYLVETLKYLQTVVEMPEHSIEYYIAYEKNEPVGIVNVISTERHVEIDGFAVAESHQRQGIGSRMQAEIGRLAGQRPVILVADAEDTAKDMYVNQGYVYQCFQYSALRET